MDYTRLGKTGLEVSRICFGTMSFGKKIEKRPWALSFEDARPMYRAAWEGGINFFDTANAYNEGTSEEITGRLIQELAPRDEIVLATKVFNRTRPGPNGMGLSRKAILHEIDESLRRLGTDYIDLYQIHRHDPFTPYEETMEVLNDVVRAGKARYIGASSMWAWQFMKYQQAAEANGWTKFVSMQNQVSLVYREEEREILPLCAADGVGIIPWSPLGAGKLTRPWGTRTERSTTDLFNKTMYDDNSANDMEIVASVEAIAKARGAAMAQVALAWLLHKPGITAPILGVSKLSHVEDALAATALVLTPEEIASLERPYRPRSVLGF
jgi:aryl-alcohol dehydrogenase-like predicted oxidoreductase